MAVPAAAVYPVAGGAYSYLFTKADQLAQHTIARPISNGDPQSSAEIFHTAFVTFFGTWHSLTSIVVLLAASAILAARAREHRPVICWGLATIVFFMNPWSAGFVARHLTSEMAYPRMFYVMPVFALTALAVADLSDRPTRRFTSALLAVAMIGAAGLYALWVGGAALPIDVPKLRVLGSARLGRPFVRMDPELRSDAREIDQILPAGNTLSAVDYELALSMTSTRLPQYGLWPIDIITFYGDVEGASADARLRHNAARFLIGIGQRELRADFEALLDTPVRNVVLSHRMVRDLSLMKTAVTGKGFTPIRETARYVLYTRPERDQ
jgi:hypothetical protein